jgi:8-oxo-dGTP pyrophosphatase MutT (NUDIX family)
MITRRTALILPYDRAGRILFQLRTDDAPHLPGYWSHFGGLIEPGESPEGAARRELMEELELDLGNESLFKRYLIRHDGVTREKFVYLIPVTQSVAQLRTQLHEGQDLNFHSLAEIKKLKFPLWDLVIATEAFDEIASRLRSPA